MELLPIMSNGKKTSNIQILISYKAYNSCSHRIIELEMNGLPLCFLV